MTIKTKSYARIGLMGNPSDGYFGKTISCAIINYCVEVSLQESATLRIVPNSELDPTQFASLSELNQLAKRDGYYGGLRLILASCKKFKDYCDQQKIDLANKTLSPMKLIFHGRLVWADQVLLSLPLSRPWCNFMV